MPYNLHVPVTSETTAEPARHRAIVLAAGNSDRFQTSTGEPKLLHPFLGRPLLLRTLAGARDAGIEHAIVVLGYEAAAVRALVESNRPAGLAVSFVVNRDWHLENGLSVLAAREEMQARPGTHFAVLMGDHLFEPALLRLMLTLPLAPTQSVLAVDTHVSDERVVAEATKVRREGARIVAIGKDLEIFDALDTGMFVCAANLFDALDRARAAGDTTLSGGIRELAGAGHMRAFEIGDAGWKDIDTIDDLADAEAALRLPLKL